MHSLLDWQWVGLLLHLPIGRLLYFQDLFISRMGSSLFSGRGRFIWPQALWPQALHLAAGALASTDLDLRPYRLRARFAADLRRTEPLVLV